MIVRFAEYQQAKEDCQLRLSRELAIGFSRELLSNGVPAWRRMQAIRALGAYRDIVLQTGTPLLADMVRKLGTLVEQERSFGGAEIPDARQERALVGLIDLKSIDLFSRRSAKACFH